MYAYDNYDSDFRVRAGRRGSPYAAVDENKNLVLLKSYSDDEEIEFWVPFEYVVCPVCEGRGKHVNPSIDCNGLTTEDFAEDPDFREAYFSGAYDVTCYRCSGKRVVPEICINESHENWELYQLFLHNQDELAEIDRMHEAERRMGA